MKRVSHLFVILTIFLSALTIVSPVYAAVTVYGRGYYRGYFTNSSVSSNINGSGPVLPAIYPEAQCPSGDENTSNTSQPGRYCSIPLSVNTKGAISNLNHSSPNTLIGFLFDAYENANPVLNNNTKEEQRRIGASFIVNTILMRDAPGSGKTLTSADWSELATLLSDPNIVMHNNQIISNVETDSTGAQVCVNSAYNFDDKDNFYYDACHTDRRGIVLFNQLLNVPIYRIWYKCANPVGMSSANQSWNVPLTTDINRTTATAGDIVVWSYTATIAGTMATDVNVNYGWHNTRTNGSTNNLFNNQITNVGVISTGANPGSGSGVYTQPYTVTSSDVIGSRLCSRATALPGFGPNGSLSRIYDTEKCVTIIPPIVVSNDCRPIQIPVVLKTYPAVSGDSHQGDSVPSVPAVTVPVDVYVDGELVAGNVSSSQTLNDPSYITSRFTDGDSHTVTFTETTSHITGYDDNDHTLYGPANPITGVSLPIGVAHDSFTTNFQPAASWTDSFQCYDYSLSSGGVTSSNNIVEAGSLIQIAAQLTNSSLTSGSSSPVGGMNLHTKTKDTFWQVSQLVIAPGSTGLSAVGGGVVTGNISTNPCLYYKSAIGVPSSNCAAVQSITDVNANPNLVTLASSSVFAKNNSVISGLSPFGNYSVVGDYEPGTKICYALSVYAVSSEPKNGKYQLNSTSVSASDVDTSGGSWLHSGINLSTNCIKVVKKPKVQVLGGDLSTGKPVSSYPAGSASLSSVITSTSVKKLNNTTGVRLFGSWVEYAIMPLGAIDGTSSASAFNGLVPTSKIGLQLSSSVSSNTITSSTICNYGRLSFANAASGVCTGTNIGNYTNSNNIPDVATSFSITNSNPLFSGGNLNTNALNTTGSGLYRTNGNIAISGGSLGVGQWVVINAGNSTVTITGNINYTNGNITDIVNIPQVVIIADRINVASGVTNIDAWLIAKGTNGLINTCHESGNSGPLTSNVCTQPLTVNGPVMARHLYLRRTAGSGYQTSSGDPAETFNLRADAYLWAYVHTSKQTPIQTTYTVELPPRL